MGYFIKTRAEQGQETHFCRRANGNNGLIAATGTTAWTSGTNSHALLLLPVDLKVDANRDGKIDDKDTTTDQKPYRFWCNDDHDDASNGDVTDGNHDYDNENIKCIRDLEDYSRLWLDLKSAVDLAKSGGIKVGLQFKPFSGDTWQPGEDQPAIKIFQAVEANGGTKYITDEATANSQITGVYDVPIENTFNGTVVGTVPFLFPSDFFDGMDSSNNGTKHLIFEGFHAGKGKLTIVFYKGTQKVGEGGSLYLDLKNIKTMYARGKSTPFDPNGLPKPFDYSLTTYDDSGISWVDDSSGNTFSKPVDEEKKVIVFVHGSNEPNLYSVANAETMFKRLWWQGYKGRFAFFRWDTLVGPLNGWLPAQYNLNEWRAWKFGKGLKAYVEKIPDTKDYTKNICGHSLGNTVIASALKQGMQVTNCVFMQGAIPAGCFDSSGGASDESSINGYQKFWDAELSRHTPDNASEKGYRGFLTGVSGNLVNFYNESDYALATGPMGAWEWNQKDYKPDSSGTAWQYAYDGSLDPGYQIKLYTVNHNYRRFVTDPHESMSFVARARSKALGARAGVGGVIRTNVNVGTGAGSVGNLSNSRSDHSGEFTRNIQQLEQFYEDFESRIE